MRMSERGSVLMELIVVFPIYLVLFGGVFMIGDMLVKSIRLASADRTAAFDVQNSAANGWQGVLSGLFHKSREVTDDGSPADRLAKESTSQYYADTAVEGPFSLRAAVTVRNDYALSGDGTRGRLAYADWFFKNSVRAPSATDDMGQLLLGNRVAMYSKDTDDRRAYAYNYYTLKKVKYTVSEYTWRDNRRPISDIVNSYATGSRWYQRVYKENWHGDVNDDANSKMLTPLNGVFDEYNRYGTFVDWSN